jgi:hypothetical protein
MGHSSERARGDSRLLDWPDVLWKLVRQDDNPNSPRFISAYGRDVDVSESRLAYDARTRRLTLVGGSRQDAKVRLALDAVVTVLTAEPGLSGRALKSKLAGSVHAKHTIEDALRLGLDSHRLSATKGPKGADLFRCVPVSRSVPPVSQGQSAERVPECPSPFIEKGHSRDVAGTDGTRPDPDQGRDTHTQVDRGRRF